MLPSKLSDQDEMDQLQNLLIHLSDRLGHLPVRYRKSISEDIEKLQAFLKGGPLFREGNALGFEESPSLGGAVLKVDGNMAIPPSGQPPGRVEVLPQFDLLQAIFQTNPAGLALVTVPDLVCRITNQVFRAMMPDPTIDPAGKWLGQLWPENEMTQARAVFQQVVATGEGVEGRYRQDSADEEGHAIPRWFSVSVEPIEWRRQPAVLVVLWETTQMDQALQEIQAQKERLRQAGERLKIGESRFRVALGSLPVTVFSMDRDLRYTWIYSPAESFSDSQYLGKRDDEFIPADDARELVEMKQSVIDTGQPLHRENRLRVNGRWRTFLLNLDPVIDAAGIVVGLTGAALDITEQRRLEAEQREYLTQMEVQRRLAEHREMERQNIASEIHDGPIQSLVSTLFHLQRVKEDMLRPGAEEHTGEEVSEPAIRFELEQVTQSLKSTVQELRMVINDLRPPTLLQFGLMRVIQIHVEDLRERFPQLVIHLDLFDDRYLLSKQVCLELYRVYQESMNNVVRHAQASQVWVRYSLEKQQMVLEIKDNGRGFVLPADWVTFIRSNHFGMAGMKERIEAIGGEFAPWSEPEKGTIVRIRVPVGKTGLEPATSSVSFVR